MISTRTILSAGAHLLPACNGIMEFCLQCTSVTLVRSLHHAQQPDATDSFLAKPAFMTVCFCMILQVLGLHTLRFFSTLMPLLLGWSHEPETATCMAALEALQEVIKHTWPRMPAHASFLWSQLQQISILHPQLQMHESPGNKGGADPSIRHCIGKIAEMLYLCGGSLFQKTIHNAWVDSKDPTADVMLQSIEVYVSAAEQHL